jgi:ATP-dependent DNA helicase PIF1
MVNITLTPRMQQAIDLANQWKTFFLTGEAGSGKSTLIRYIIQTINKKNIVMVAPTGIAAINIWWATIHNVFWIKPDQTPWVGRSLDNKKFNVLKLIDLLIVDEVSMLRIDLLESMDKTLKYARNNDFFMWWVQTIFVWDLLQLPPIIDDKLYNMIREKKWYKSWYVFDYQWWKDYKVETVILDKVFRQKDNNYIAALNKIRKWEQTMGVLNYLNAHCCNKKYDWTSIVLTPTNKLADLYNNRMINKLKWEDAEYFEFKAKNHWFNEKEFPAPMLLRLCIWSRVLIVVNDKNWLYVNGTMWTFVDFQDGMLVIEKDNWEKVYLEKYLWPKNVPMKKPDSEDEIEFVKVGQYEQYPIKYWRAITQHKSQWCTFDKVHIDLWPRTFATWQLYVALSRCTSLAWMTFSKPLENRHVLTDKYVLDYLNRND